MTIKFIIIILILCLFLSGCGIVPEIPEIDYPVYRALLVGVGDYISYSDLQSPPYNVDRMRDILTNCRFTEDEFEFTIINELKDWDATKENILEAIVNTFMGADENDISYFYWNGHGNNKTVPHILPSDCTNFISSRITVHELESYLSAVPGTKIVILDTCHSGGFIGKSFTKDLLISDDFQVITSCAGYQVCWENPNISVPYCYFTMGIYQGCQNDIPADDNNDGIIDLRELWYYAKTWAMDHKCNSCQTAQYFPEGSTFPIVEY